MLNKFIEQEKSTIVILDNVLQEKSVRREIDLIAKRVEQKLMDNSRSDLAWEPVSLDAYKTKLPEMILWVGCFLCVPEQIPEPSAIPTAINS